MVTEVLCYFPDIHKCRWSTCRDSAEEAGIGGLLWGYYMLWNYQSSSRVCQGPAQWSWCCSITTTDCLQTIPRGNEAGYSPCRSRPCKDSKYHISLAFCIWTWAAVWPKLKSWKKLVHGKWYTFGKCSRAWYYKLTKENWDLFAVWNWVQLYFDDSVRNIAGGKAAGLHTVLVNIDHSLHLHFPHTLVFRLHSWR